MFSDNLQREFKLSKNTFLHFTYFNLKHSIGNIVVFCSLPPIFVHCWRFSDGLVTLLIRITLFKNFAMNKRLNIRKKITSTEWILFFMCTVLRYVFINTYREVVYYSKREQILAWICFRVAFFKISRILISQKTKKKNDMNMRKIDI